MANLSLNFTFDDLHNLEGLKSLDQEFTSYLMEGDPSLAERLQRAREAPPSGLEESCLLLDLAPYVEDFVGVLFSIEAEIEKLQHEIHHLAPLYRCKRLFIQRQVAKAYSKEEAQQFNGAILKQDLEKVIGKPYSDLSFSSHVLQALEDKEAHAHFLKLATQYAAWSLYQPASSTLFRLPRKIDPEALIPLERKGQILTSPTLTQRKGFDCTDSGLNQKEALDQVNYCILCHPQGKDTCSKGLSESHKGCPLDQKISEMNTLAKQGNMVGALAMIMVDNPMVAATGHRICNDCSKACIFQKQESVDVPGVETHILDSVLNLPWGMEIYSLLSRWNPLNFKNPLPKSETGYKVLVAGMGPAGFTLAHYLLNEGHTVVGIDGLKIEPLDQDLIHKPIRDWSSLNTPLSERVIDGFGGVTEYGITARWNKSYLKLIRILLERRSHFSLYDGVRLGSTLTLPQAFDLGFDHMALCLGAGRPNTLDIPHGLAKGIRSASDFLMSLQLTGAAQKDSLANLQIRLPIVVVGGGLTAVDTATEALAYYPVQVEKFLKRREELGGHSSSLTEEEKDIANEFLTDAKALRKSNLKCLKGASTLLYRRRIQDSPSYRLNAKELEDALSQGVQFREDSTPIEIKLDEHGHIESLLIKTKEGIETLPCRTLLFATGTQPNRILEQEDPHLKIEGPEGFISYQGQNKVSFFGDLNPDFQGSVVKAMASAKRGAPLISEALLQAPPSSTVNLVEKLEETLMPRVETVKNIAPEIWEVVLKAPQAAGNFKPGQFFRLQKYGHPTMEGIALTGAEIHKDKGLLSLIILEMGASSAMCKTLKPGEKVVLMGPTGTPTKIPQNETVLLIGGGLGNAVLFSIGQALKENHNKVIYVAGYKSAEKRFKAKNIEDVSDHVIWCCEEGPLISPSRPQDLAVQGNVIDGILAYVTSSPALSLSKVTRILTIGSDRMMAAVANARKTILKDDFNPDHKAICSLNSPMQCMMKEICGQCLQQLKDPVTGETRVIFACTNQDQSLDEVDFQGLQDRLGQNSLLEKQARLWHERETI